MSSQIPTYHVCSICKFETCLDVTFILESPPLPPALLRHQASRRVTRRIRHHQCTCHLRHASGGRSPRVRVKKKEKKHSESSKTKDEVLESFHTDYRNLILSMPRALQPTSGRHGQHSYTVFLDQQHTGFMLL